MILILKIVLLVCYCGPVAQHLIYIIMVTRQVSHLSTLHASTKLSQPTLRYDTNHTQLQLLVCFYIYLCFISMPDECFMNMMCIWQCVCQIELATNFAIITCKPNCLSEIYFADKYPNSGVPHD